MKNHHLGSFGARSALGLAFAATLTPWTPGQDDTTPQPLGPQTVSTYTLTLPNLGVTIHQTKTLDPATGEVVGQAVDDFGRLVDVAELLRRETRVRLATPGAKLDPELAITLNANDRARVAIAWSANANSSYTTTALNADLDITVLRGSSVTSGTSYGSSSSANNNFEIVEFTPTTAGTYTLRINDYRFSGSSERVGIAWSQRTLDSGT